jgi:branched-chain amino acid aminotransferase
VLDQVASGEARMLLTGSVRNVQPTAWLDGVDLEIGELSSAAREVFERLMRERLDP